MIRIGLLGKNGFIGSNVLEILGRQFFVVAEPKSCDVLVNCAGFSRMYEGNAFPMRMQAVEDTIWTRIREVEFRDLIHLSTTYIDVYPNDIYSKIKIKMERRILSQYPDTCILRLGGVIGKGLRKNVVYDLLHDKPLFVDQNSVYNYISVADIGQIIIKLLMNFKSGIFNVGAQNSISAVQIASLLGKSPVYGSKKEFVNMDVSKLQAIHVTKTTEEYIKEFHQEYKNE